LGVSIIAPYRTGRSGEDASELSFRTWPDAAANSSLPGPRLCDQHNTDRAPLRARFTGS
jgi:hypothetical protein